MEWDVWVDAYGRFKAFPATRAVVDDSNAPYGFKHHEIRVAAVCARDALKAARAQLGNWARLGISSPQKN